MLMSENQSRISQYAARLLTESCRLRICKMRGVSARLLPMKGHQLSGQGCAQLALILLKIAEDFAVIVLLGLLSG